MGSFLNAMLVGVVLLNLFALGTSRIRALIHAAALQGVLLGVMAEAVHEHASIHSLSVAVATILLKGALLPHILLRALRDAQIKREIEPLIGFMPSILLGSLGAALSIAIATKLPMAPGQRETLIIPAAFSTIFTGFLLLTTRIKAITQVIGYLFLENGIFIFGLLLAEAVPFLVEIGVLLDLFVVVFVASIILHHINRQFDSLDTRKLSSLKD
jgi:hydrogenase-4 component E